MDRATRNAITDWLLEHGLAGAAETELLRGFCERCQAAGIDLHRGVVFMDTLHPILEGRGWRWGGDGNSGAAMFEYPRHTSPDDDHRWRLSPFYRLLENGETLLHLNLESGGPFDYPVVQDLAGEGCTGYMAAIHRFDRGKAIGPVDCTYSSWSTRRAGGFSADDLDDMRSLLPAFLLAIKTATMTEVARTLAHVYLGRDAGERVLGGRITRGVAERINAVLWYSDLRSSTSISDTAAPEEIIPFLNDYAAAAIDAIHGEGGDVLKLMGDGILAIFGGARTPVAGRAALRAERRFRENIRRLDVERAALERPTTSAYVGLHCGEVFYGNIGSNERLDFTVVGPAVNEVSRIASMCRAVDRDLLVSAALIEALGPVEQEHFVSTGRFALRGVGRAQTLYTLDPAVSADSAHAVRYAHCLDGAPAGRKAGLDNASP